MNVDAAMAMATNLRVAGGRKRCELWACAGEQTMCVHAWQPWTALAIARDLRVPHASLDHARVCVLGCSPWRDWRLRACAAMHCSRIAEGVQSVAEAVADVDSRSELLSLCLHGNRVAHCAGLGSLTALSELNLSANAITTLEGCAELRHLRTLNLASNHLESLDGLPALPQLERLNAAHNRISCLRGLSALHAGPAPLAHLDLRNNALHDLTELVHVAPLAGLRRLQLAGGSHGNAIAALPSLYAAVATALPQVRRCTAGAARGVCKPASGPATWHSCVWVPQYVN